MIRLLLLYTGLIGKSMGLVPLALAPHVAHELQDLFASLDSVNHVHVGPSEVEKMVHTFHLLPRIFPQIQPEPPSSELRLPEVTGQQVAGRMDIQCAREAILKLPAIEDLAKFVKDYHLEGSLRSLVDYCDKIRKANPVLRHSIEDPLWASALCLHIPFFFALDPKNGANYLLRSLIHSSRARGRYVAEEIDKVEFDAAELGLICLSYATICLGIHASMGYIALYIVPPAT